VTQPGGAWMSILGEGANEAVGGGAIVVGASDEPGPGWFGGAEHATRTHATVPSSADRHTDRRIRPVYHGGAGESDGFGHRNGPRPAEHASAQSPYMVNQPLFTIEQVLAG
jgi:hypothetical protein